MSRPSRAAPASPSSPDGPVVRGLLLVEKPPGVTSHDVVNVVRRKLGLRRIGHTGTLDPLAQGLLILLVGSATRSQQDFQNHEKVYEAVLQLGTRTDTGDADGAPVATAPVPVLVRDAVAEILASFRGPLSQTPPAYSAVKVRGRPAYWWARRGHPVAVPSRTVQVAEIGLVECREASIAFRVRCSAGTYIRTLGEAIAERLGTVGHLTSLVRLRIGAWSLEHAKPLSWIRAASPEAVARELKPLDP